jgi:uncharacterized membrane protein YjfL (UPF0719 family)
MQSEHIISLYGTLLGFVYSIKQAVTNTTEGRSWVELITGQAGAIVLALVFLWVSWKIIQYLVKKNDESHAKHEQLYKELLAMKEKEIEDLKQQLRK